MTRTVLLLLTVALFAALLKLALLGNAPVHDQLQAQTVEPADSATPSATPQFQIIRGQPGFWRLALGNDGVWWFLSPQGTPEFLNGVSTVQPFQVARNPEGPHYISRDWDGKLSDNGNLAHWAQQTLTRVHQIGFKMLGAWCHPIFHEQDIPATRDLNVWLWMSGIRRFYDPRWAPAAEQAIREQVQLLRESRNLVGYYIDNELDWGDTNSGPGVYFDYLPKDDPNRRQVIAVLKTLWPTLEAFNSDWETTLTRWEELDEMVALPHHRQQAYGRLFSAWLEHLARDYFQLTTDLIRKHDPNHLILGIRFKGMALREVARAARDFTDAQSINYYVNDAVLDAEMFRMMYAESAQPIIISEYSFHSLDGRSGNRNTVGFPAQVLDQQARADGYRLFTRRIARVPYIVGCEWFQWADEPPSGRSFDGEDVNFGIHDVQDQPYELLVAAVQETTPLLNGLHARSARDDNADVWRPNFAERTAAYIPKLSRAIVLDGDLGDWPAEARLRGIRRSQTVGLERSRLPLPAVYVAWQDAGLYIAFEVIDDRVEGTPPQGWWWTLDNAEVWLSTRPVPAEQSGYNVYSHSFFFVPQNPAAADNAGYVGQWHRPGDALADHLIPHPKLQHASRLTRNGYVAEIFLPAEALHGWDPANHPELAFNIHVRNYEHALEYFWSAPKEVLTQLRPNTWGTLRLQK